MSYTYKHSQLYAFPIIENNINLFFDSRGYVDLLRVSFSATNVNKIIGVSPGLLIWSNLNNNYIGSCASTTAKYSVGSGLELNDTLEPANGVELFYNNKVHVIGEYNFKFYEMNGNLIDPADYDVDSYINILIEYYRV